MVQRSILMSYYILSIIICRVTALKCTKLVTIDGISAMDEQIFTEGLYAVNTTLPTNSTEFRELATSLQDHNIAEFKDENFVATLLPQHIKKVRTYFMKACCDVFIFDSYAVVRMSL